MFHLWEKINKGEVYMIAEMSANHGGSLENALEIVKQSALSGADCLKIQTYTADSITINCGNDYFKIQGGLWDGYNLYHLYQDAGTPYEWQRRIKEECKKYGIDFLSTPFDKPAVDFLEGIGAEAYKIASFELVDIPLIEYAASKGKPMILSTGMGNPDEIQDAINACRRKGNEQILLLKCCSEYPASWKDMHLGNIPDMKERFKVPIGLSDHSIGSLGAVVGVTLGACVIEKHVRLNGVESADSRFSMTIEEYAQMVKDVRNAKQIANGPDYALTRGEKASTVFRRSIFAVKDIHAGEEFTHENVRVIRPGYGARPKYLADMIGKKSPRDICRGNPVLENDFQKSMDIDSENLFLRPAQVNDMLLLFQWANDETVRKNAFHTEKITLEEHSKWFTNLLQDDNQRQYLLISDKEPVGQIRISLEGYTGIISYSIAPEKRGLGYGKAMIRLLQQQVEKEVPHIKTLVAKVKPSNISSVHCFKQNGFKEVYQQYEFDMNSYREI